MLNYGKLFLLISERKLSRFQNLQDLSKYIGFEVINQMVTLIFLVGIKFLGALSFEPIVQVEKCLISFLPMKQKPHEECGVVHVFSFYNFNYKE